MGKDNTIKITEEEALELLRERLCHLRERTDFFDTLFKSMGGYAVIASDFDGNILIYNEEVIKYYGYTHEEIVGGKMNIEVFFPKDFIETEKLQQAIENTMANGTYLFEEENVKKDGCRFPAQVLLALVRSKDGTMFGFIVIVQDITERKRWEMEIKKLNEDLEHRVIERTAQLNASIKQLINEINERKRAEERVRFQLQCLAALHEIDKAILSCHDLGLILHCFLDKAVTQLHVNAADIYLFNPYIQMLKYAAGKGFRTPDTQSLCLHLNEGNAGRVAHERRIISIPDMGQDKKTDTHLVPGGESFIAYYGVPLIAKGQLKGVFEVFHRTPLNPDPEWLNFLESLGAQVAIAIDNVTLYEDLQFSNTKLVLAYDATLDGWARALDLRDKETEGHSQRVTEMTVKLASAMGISEAELIHVRRGALLHDIGKIGISDNILHKPGPLTDEEWAIMRKHPVYAHEMLFPIAYIRPALEIPYCHHEKWDGTGYPRRLKGEQIPFAARIFAVVDVWDALCSGRPYKPAWPHEKVRAYISSLAGTQLDPKVVQVFLEMKW